MFAWLRELNKKERRTMLACFGGWSCDALDVQVYSFVIPALLAAWGISKGQAGLLGTITLLVSAFGGWFTGVLSDRFGRVKMLQITIVWYAFFTFLSGFTSNFTEMFICRALQGFGFGGEWTAGAVLLGEVIRDKYRGRAVGFVQSGWSIGWAAAAIMYTVLFSIFPEELAWRVMFWIGLAPALMVIWMRRHVTEPEVFEEKRQRKGASAGSTIFAMFQRDYIGTTLKASLLVTATQGGQYAYAVWLPTYLKTVRNLSVINTGSFLFVLILGSFCGFIAGAYLADGIGRKKTFLLSAIGSGVMILVYMLAPISNELMLFLGFPLGFFVYAGFSPMGPYLTELYPTAIRGTGQGFCFAVGRGIGAIFPALVGFLSGAMGLGQAIALFSFSAYALMVISLLMLPETNGRGLDWVEDRTEDGRARAAAAARS
jgi:MFS family permease